LQPLTLNADERIALERLARRRVVSRQFAERARIILECSEGRTNSEVADRMGLAKPTVGNGASAFGLIAFLD